MAIVDVFKDRMHLFASHSRKEFTRTAAFSCSLIRASFTTVHTHRARISDPIEMIVMILTIIIIDIIIILFNRDTHLQKNSRSKQKRNPIPVRGGPSPRTRGRVSELAKLP